MNTKNLLLAFVATGWVGSASAQTAPISPRASQAPATMASPNTTRSSMRTAAAGVGTVVTDTARSGQSRKSTKTKGWMTSGKGKVKTKM